MKRINGERAFGRIDPGFEQRLEVTLSLLRSEKEKKEMKQKIKLMPLVAIALLIFMTGLALAASNHWGLRDFFKKGLTEYMLPEVDEMIVQPSDQHQEKGETASLTVREVLSDSTGAAMIVNVAPKDENTLMVMADSLLTDPLSDLGERFADETMTIGEYAAQNGKETVYRLTFGFGESGIFIHSMDYQMEEDGSMSCHLSASAEEPLPEEMPVTLTCYMYDLFGEREIKEQVSFTIRRAGDYGLDPVVSLEPAVFDEFGLSVGRVTLSGSPAGFRAVAEIEVVDGEKYRAYSGCSFVFLDEDGNPYPEAYLGDWGEIGLWPLNPDEIDTDQWYGDWEKRWGIAWGEDHEAAYDDIPIYSRYVLRATLPAAKNLPKEVRMTLYDHNTQTLYSAQAITIPLQ